MTTSCPRSSMQQSVLSRLGAIQPPCHHLWFFCSRDRNMLVLLTTGLSGWFLVVDAKGRSPPRAVLSWLHLLRHHNANAHDFQYFLVCSTNCAGSNCWGSTLELLTEPAELGVVLWSPLCCPFAEWCWSSGLLTSDIFPALVFPAGPMSILGILVAATSSNCNTRLP